MVGKRPRAAIRLVVLAPRRNGIEAFISLCDICCVSTWLVLTATLPTTPSGLRVRVWRALKATGAGTLREGVYLLPEAAPTAPALWDLARTIVAAGADAHLLVVPARDEAQAQAFAALFDRSAACAALLQAIQAVRASLHTATAVQLRKQLRAVAQQWQGLQGIDFFPGPHSQQVADALAALRRAVALQLSPDEPAPTQAAIAARSVADFQGRTWATRQRPWVDRLATAWLVQRFVDRAPRFVWLAEPAQCPASALGYDFDGATFTHVGDQVTFEVVAHSFGLLGDPALRRLAALVHAIDIGGAPVDEAAGVELLVRGLQARHADDDALLAAATTLFDAVYAAMQVPHAP